MAAARVLPVEERPIVSPDVVRRWAIEAGLPVGTRGHMPKSVIEAYNAKHRKSRAVNNNPWSAAKRQKESNDG